MRSAAIVGPLPPLKGGISQHTARVADAMKTFGYDVGRFSWRHQYPKVLYRRSAIDPDAVGNPGTRWDLSWFNPVSWVRTGRMAKEHDIVFTPWVSPFHFLPLLVLLWFSRASVRVIHVHNVRPHERMPFAGLLARLVLGRADLLLCHAESIRAELEQLSIEVPTCVLPMPSLLGIEPSSLPPSPPVKLLFAGTIRHYKGLDLAIAALELVDPAVYSLTIAGEVWSEDSVPSVAALRARGMSVDERLGYVADNELSELLQSHHVLLAPYRAATQSGVVSLAQSAGRVVVATAVGGLVDSIAHGEDGILTDPEDPQAFADGIELAAADLMGMASAASRKSTSWLDYVSQLTALADQLSPPAARITEGEAS